MKHSFFSFGEHVHGYDIRVFNEREVRAAAGILFVGAMVAFMNAWLVGNFEILKVFVVIFFVDFTLRLFVNPQIAPSMILARLAIHNQVPEYAGAPQKRFAWAIGWMMALTMIIVVNILEIRGIFNLIMCLLCLTFMFAECAFGICVGCKLYEAITHKKAKLCPGGVCGFHQKTAIQKIHTYQIVTLTIFVITLVTILYLS